MRKTGRFRVKAREFGAVLYAEYGHIFKDAGVLLIMVFAIFIYATLYSFAYNNQTLRDIPVGVVDNSHTASSRHLLTIFDAMPNIKVSETPASMEEAKRLFYKREIYGIVYIPEDYEDNLLSGVPATVGVYADASYFLMYKQVFSDVVTGLTGIGTEVEFSRLLASGASIPQAEALVSPVKLSVKNLYNPYLGYGSFIMPAILVLIIQQTLLIGIGMIGGTWRERGVYSQLRTPGERRLSTIPVVLGKAVAYVTVYAATMFYIFGVHYRLFNYPMNGEFLHIVAFLTPYLLSCIFLGIALSTLFQYRENSILFMLWSSIPILLLSGASLPKESIPTWLYNMGKIFPSSSGIEGFLKIQTNGATLSEVSTEYYTLWLLAGIYFVLSCLGIRMLLNRKGIAR